jgi:hypothetical protein
MNGGVQNESLLEVSAFLHIVYSQILQSYLLMSNMKERAVIYATDGDFVNMGAVQNSLELSLRIVREVSPYKLSYLR